MKLNICLLVTFLLIALIGKSHGHEEQRAEINELWHRVNALLWKTEILRMHNHSTGCLKPENRDSYLNIIKESYEKLGLEEDIIDTFIAAYAEVAKVCGEETDITYKNNQFALALLLENAFLGSTTVKYCWKRSNLNQHLVKIREKYESSKYHTKEGLEIHIDKLRNVVNICEEN